MRRTLIILLFGASSALAQGTVVSDDRLPPDSIELKRNDPPATSTPWQLPKPGDPLYDAEKEAQIKRENAAKVKGSSTEHPDKSDYFQTPPEKRPWNVPDDHIPVRVFQGKTFIGWTYISKEAVARLHKPKKT